MSKIRKSQYAQTLITAVHEGSVTCLRTKIFLIQSQEVNTAWRNIAISQGLPKTGITALHVACRLYSLAETQPERDNAENMVSVLIQCGAFLTVDALIDGRKQTPLEVCNGNAPQLLIDAIKASTLRLNIETKHFSKTIYEKSKRFGIDEKRLEVMSSGYAFYYGGMASSL